MNPLFASAWAVALATSVIIPTTSAQSLTLSQSSAAVSSSQSLDEAKIAVIIQSVATFADQNYFEGMEPLYADEIQVDYTSLWDGDIQIHTPESLMTAWAGVLPGFDQSYHNISNIQVEVADNRATATADVTADHYLEASFWQVTGQYEYRFVKQADQWRITHMTFNLINEAGSRALVTLASDRVSQ